VTTEMLRARWGTWGESEWSSSPAWLSEPPKGFFAFHICQIALG